MTDLPKVKAVLEYYGATITRDSGQVYIKCPFHDDTHKSGSANLNEQVFVCFACGMSGNSLQLICKREGVDFNEANSIAEGIAGACVGQVRGKHLNGLRLPKKQGYNSRGSTAGSIRRSRGA